MVDLTSRRMNGGITSLRRVVKNSSSSTIILSFPRKSRRSQQRSTNILFLHSLDENGPSFGSITKLPNGWPSAPLPLRHRPAVSPILAHLPQRSQFLSQTSPNLLLTPPLQWGNPSRTMMRAFNNCAAELIIFMNCFEDGYRDHDWDHFRRACNIEYFDHPEWTCRTRWGVPIREFTEEIFEAIVWRSDRDGGGFT